MKSKQEIKSYQLDDKLYYLHKKGAERSDFGLDASLDLIEGGFGLYSSVDLKNRIGPVKTHYYRIALFCEGSASIDLGLENYQPQAQSMVFGFPGQVFSLYDLSEDVQIYYLLFKESFMADTPLLKDHYPFFSYLGVQSFALKPEEAEMVLQLIFSINVEIKQRRKDTKRMIQLYVQQIIIIANRAYQRLFPVSENLLQGNNSLFKRFIKLVGHHFMTMRKVSDYALLLNVSTDHLNRIIKSQSEKTAGELIDEMIFTEAKAYLLHTELSNAEIAYQLAFADPSHFNKFFKKLAHCTPLEFRAKS